MEYIDIVEATRRLDKSDRQVRRMIHAGTIRIKPPASGNSKLELLASDVDKLSSQTVIAKQQERLDKVEQQSEALRQRLDILGSQIDTLSMQLDTLSSEFRGFADDIHSRLARPAEQPKILRPPKAEYTSSGTTPPPADDIPSDAVAYHDFADRHKVHQRTFRDHITKGLVPAIERDKPNRPGAKIRYLTPEQQAQALAFWSRNRTRFEPCDDPECPCHE